MLDHVPEFVELIIRSGIGIKCSSPCPSGLQNLIPLDPTYWKSLLPGHSDYLMTFNHVSATDGVWRPSAEWLHQFLRITQLKCQCIDKCKSTNAEILTENSIFQLSFLRSSDPQFHPNLKNVNPAFVEWVYPVFTTIHDIAEQALQLLLVENDRTDCKEVLSLVQSIGFYAIIQNSVSV